MELGKIDISESEILTYNNDRLLERNKIILENQKL